VKRVKDKELEMETKIIKSEEKLRQLKEIVYKVSKALHTPPDFRRNYPRYILSIILQG
jgi:hypothetical protein